MRLLCYVHERTKLWEVQDFLSSKGVPTRAGLRRFADADPVALFVCIDAQYEDAVALLRDPRSVVTHPIDVELWSRAVNQSGLGVVLKYALLFLAVLLSISGAVLAAHFFR